MYRAESDDDDDDDRSEGASWTRRRRAGLWVAPGGEGYQLVMVAPKVVAGSGPGTGRTWDVELDEAGAPGREGSAERVAEVLGAGAVTLAVWDAPGTLAALEGGGRGWGCEPVIADAVVLDRLMDRWRRGARSAEGVAAFAGGAVGARERLGATRGAWAVLGALEAILERFPEVAGWPEGFLGVEQARGHAEQLVRRREWERSRGRASTGVEGWPRVAAQEPAVVARRAPVVVAPAPEVAVPARRRRGPLGWLTDRG